MSTDLQWNDNNQSHKTNMNMLMLSIATLGASGAITGGLFTWFFFSGFVVAVTAIFCGVCGLFLATLLQVGGGTQDEDLYQIWLDFSRGASLPGSIGSPSFLVSPTSFFTSQDDISK